jgi:sugar lactone lactonase YvrE
MSPTTAAGRPDPSDGSEIRGSDERTPESGEPVSPERDGRGPIDHARRGLLKALPLAGVALVGSGTASARTREHVIEAVAPGNGSRRAFPEVVPLPDGFQPEGIVTGRGTEFFVGSLVDGSVYRGDLRTGEGEVLVSLPADSSRVAVGLSYDRRSDHLFVAGNGTGKAFVYDAETGEDAAVYDLTAPGTFVNDVVVTRTAAYFTDSFRPFLYRVPLGPGGQLPDPGAVEEIPLGGDFESVPGFNTNGIDASPDGEYLIVVNSTTGLLYRVDPTSGEASLIDLGDETVTNGDGILLDGTTLYVVRNSDDLIAVVELDPEATRGEVVRFISDPDFRVPTTVAEFGNALYAVNARFGIPEPETAAFEVVRVAKRPKS